MALRALQQEQEAALLDGDTELLAELCARGHDLARRLAPDAVPDAERDAVNELAPQVREAQAQLEGMAAQIRGSILDQLRALGPGRDALAGYRPPARDNSRLVDRTH